MTHLQHKRKGRPIDNLAGGPQKPENLSDTLKYFHSKKSTLINEQLTTKQNKTIEALLLTNTIDRAAKRANVRESAISRLMRQLKANAPHWGDESRLGVRPPKVLSISCHLFGALH